MSMKGVFNNNSKNIFFDMSFSIRLIRCNTSALVKASNRNKYALWQLHVKCEEISNDSTPNDLWPATQIIQRANHWIAIFFLVPNVIWNELTKIYWTRKLGILLQIFFSTWNLMYDVDYIGEGEENFCHFPNLFEHSKLEMWFNIKKKVKPKKLVRSFVTEAFGQWCCEFQYATNSITHWKLSSKYVLEAFGKHFEWCLLVS